MILIGSLGPNECPIQHLGSYETFLPRSVDFSSSTSRKSERPKITRESTGERKYERLREASKRLFFMAHTSVDVRTEMGDWPGRTGSAPAYAAPFGLHVPGLLNINPGFSLLGERQILPREPPHFRGGGA
jgi:hypothetical protein